MNIEHRKEDGGGLFYVEQAGEIKAEMTYSLSSSGTMVIEHTEVSDELQGRHIGQELVHAGVDYAREQDLKIVPQCPFAKALIQKKPEWSDVLA